MDFRARPFNSVDSLLVETLLSYLTSQYLSFLTRKMEIIVIQLHKDIMQIN